MKTKRLEPYHWPSVIFLFIVQLVRDTGITKGDEAKTGYYAGFIVSCIINSALFKIHMKS